MKKTVHTTVERRFRVELSKEEILAMLRLHPQMLPPDTSLPERDYDIEITVGDDHTYVENDVPLVLRWTMTDVSENSNG